MSPSGSNKRAATLTDVAKKAGVSIATASRTLNGGTRHVRQSSYFKVTKAAKELGYQTNTYAQAVARGSASTIVLLVSDICDPYFATIAQEVVTTSSEYGVSVTIEVVSNAQQELESTRRAIALRPRGIILSESEYVGAPENRMLIGELTKYVSQGGKAICVTDRGSKALCAIDIPNRAGARVVAKFLIESGYRRPLILRGDDHLRTSVDRLAGILEVFEHANLATDDNAICNGSFTRAGGYAAVTNLIRTDSLRHSTGRSSNTENLYNGKGIDSIITLNDVMAVGAMTALRDNGVQPGSEVGVIGFGDTPLSADVYPALTTVRLPLKSIGSTAVHAILDNEIQTSDTGHLIVVEGTPEIVLRKSLPIIKPL